MRPQTRRDRGSASSEIVILAPVTFLMIFLVVQLGVWAHATHVAHAAADAGLAAARADRSTAAAGNTEAAAVLADLGGQILTDTRVTATRTATDADVTVTGTAASVVPFLKLPVRVQVSGPVERFAPQ